MFIISIVITAKSHSCSTIQSDGTSQFLGANSDHSVK